MNKWLCQKILGLTGVLLLTAVLPVEAHKNLIPLGRQVSRKVTGKGVQVLPSETRYLAQLRTTVERAVAARTVSAQALKTAAVSASGRQNQSELLPFSANQLFKADGQAGGLQRLPFPGKEQIDAVIFDMDGTLLESLPVWEHSASNFLRSQGIAPEAGLDEEMAKLSLQDGAQILKERYHLPQTKEEIIALTLAPIHEHYLTDIPAKPGALELLKRLHAQGIKIGVATASDKKLARRAFERLGMKQYIRYITSCDEVGIGKQNSAVYDATAAKLGTTRERTLVVEDALYALETAKKAGYITAAVAEPYHPAEHAQAILVAGDYFINSFLDGYIWSHF